ncbi:GNAT family N-acetyltransferase [Clostridium sp. D2Q-11]|uniref:GNAT family N-acetyltransferase n=1 Tax=Anaeromonas frigoriresistens TaxID=2683708 RepID=A0A942UZG7_9FIRM|nr:GNAT family protein [Anaeromonas frigoriresistens]MBS4538407.1 GNAT family N-acetyltransferase [Anaeromonas frigoriresistens]
MLRIEEINNKGIKKIVEWNEGKTTNYIRQWAGPVYSSPLTEKTINERIEKEGSKIQIFQIVDVENKEIIGTIELVLKDKEKGIGHIGRFLIGNEENRNKGFGQRVLKNIVQIGFDEYNLNQITLAVFDFNKNAISCYEKVGFKVTEYREKLFKREGNDVGSYIMTIKIEDYQ